MPAPLFELISAVGLLSLAAFGQNLQIE